MNTRRMATADLRARRGAAPARRRAARAAGAHRARAWGVRLSARQLLRAGGRRPRQPARLRGRHRRDRRHAGDDRQPLRPDHGYMAVLLVSIGFLWLRPDGLWSPLSLGHGPRHGLPLALLALALAAVPWLVNDFFAYQLGLFLLYGIVDPGRRAVLGPRRLPVARPCAVLRPRRLPVGLHPEGARPMPPAGSRCCRWPLLLPAGLAYLIGLLVFARRDESGPFFSLITLALVMLGFQVAQPVEQRHRRLQRPRLDSGTARARPLLDAVLAGRRGQRRRDRRLRVAERDAARHLVAGDRAERGAAAVLRLCHRPPEGAGVRDQRVRRRPRRAALCAAAGPGDAARDRLRAVGRVRDLDRGRRPQQPVRRAARRGRHRAAVVAVARARRVLGGDRRVAVHRRRAALPGRLAGRAGRARRPAGRLRRPRPRQRFASRGRATRGRRAQKPHWPSPRCQRRGTMPWRRRRRCWGTMPWSQRRRCPAPPKCRRHRCGTAPPRTAPRRSSSRRCGCG